ncbi:MAG: KUP/HAK/KT family potassium transporter [Pseudomonadota bacterium]
MGQHSDTKTRVLVLSALGVVFGDIGTSPLYTLRVCFSDKFGLAPGPENVLGLLSLIFWALILVISVKYALFIMRADDHGQGGIFAMLALLHKQGRPRLGRRLTLLGLFGSALLYGDGLITPVISVLSALEGLEVATAAAKPLVLPLTCAVLTGLFLVQSHGTGRMGRLFGPIIVVWFAALIALGLPAILARPQVLQAVNPVHAMGFFLHNGLHGFLVLGAVVLCVTGCEALYADMGHFGKNPIRISWYGLALPALLCNYFGQGALILADPRAVADPFYGLVPPALLYPMVALATAATIIASQAIISGVFSLTRQAIQLGFMPRMRIIHTSAMAEGQVYIPEINAMMLIAALALTLVFRESEELAGAYGIAVTADMFITSMMFFLIARRVWTWPLAKALAPTLLFWMVDASLFGSCLAKLLQGGWFPVLVGLCFMLIMATWWDGWKMLAAKVFKMRLPLDRFIGRIVWEKPVRSKGTGVFLSTFRREIPPMLLYQLNHTKALHEQVVILSILTEQVAEVAEEQQLEMRYLGKGVYRLKAHFGFMETPTAPWILAQAKARGLKVDLARVKYYIGRMALIPAQKPTMPRWQRFLFLFMYRNAVSPVVFYSIPPEDVLELGIQVEF